MERLLPGVIVLGVFLALAPLRSSAEQDFSAYLSDVRQQAIEQGVSVATVDKAFVDLVPDERVIGFDRRQPEFVQTFDEYLTARVSDYRKREGRRLFEVHRTLLEEIAETYQVDAEYIVAFWGLETSFGGFQGNYSIVRSLATLGYDPRRSAFFTRELVHALKILDEGHVTADNFVGAWAGAMGQSQFMPSSFLTYAQDYDGDGRKDIWSNEADVFASIANYLAKAGWQRGAGWGGAVTLADIDFAALKPETYDTKCRALRHHSRPMKPQQWQELGVIPKQPLMEQPYALIEPEAGDVSGYLAGGNYRAILSYNCANKYAVSVGLMAQAIAAQP